MNKKIVLVLLIITMLFLSGCIDVGNNSTNQTTNLPNEQTITTKEIKNIQQLKIYIYPNSQFYETVTVFTDGMNKCYIYQNSISCV